jgi:hypothetical protein
VQKHFKRFSFSKKLNQIIQVDPESLVAGHTGESGSDFKFSQEGLMASEDAAGPLEFWKSAQRSH